MAKFDPSPALYWVKEREAIRQRRAAGDPFPWTDDPILRDNKFCCVRREDDRVTLWIDKNIRKPFADDPNLWFMLCIARQINWPPTLEYLMKDGAWPLDDSFHCKMMSAALRRIERDDKKVFTGAYLLGGGNNSGMPKIPYICEKVLGNVWKHREDYTRLVFTQTTPRSLERAHQALMEYLGWGPFLAYQVVVDMRFTPLLNKAYDIRTYAAAGPGTRRGLNRLWGRPVRTPLSQEQALDEMKYLYEIIQKKLKKIPMDFSDVPNVLCETDKMIRMQKGEGKMRSKFTPSKEPLP